MSVFRGALRNVPLPLLREPSVVESLLQPVANNVGWPSLSLPAGISVHADTVAGLQGEWLLPTGQDATAERLLLWAHGGGFVFCSPGTHRFFLAKVAARSQLPVFCVNYRKPPQFPFPAPGHDVLATYRALRRKSSGQKLFLGGDSAGGNIALEVARTISERSKLQDASKGPAGLVLLSPWVDLSDTSACSWHQNQGIDYVPVEQARAVAATYAAGRSLEDVQISPGRRGSWPDSLPRVLLEYGGAEVFCSQIETLLEALRASNVEVAATAEEGMVHAYPMLDFLWTQEPKVSEPFFDRLDQFLRC
eukprot:TRINITY_DN77560_c0_g1_i1.p1 TRINITY_DN77560_c0_g1~~TRINITY_DN77560_c0_g1_i1.p1  ORF type:complete len:328 (-),score=53.03 TRINITY_DN77560_c0_g1_i1:17-934(-)